MTRTKTRSIFLLAALAMAAILGVAAYRVADAATPVASIFPHGRGFGGGLNGGYDGESLATALGISTDELNAAYAKAKENAINQALADGLITQTQADQLSERGIAFPFLRWRGWLSENGIDFEALLADALGISVETLQDAYQQAYQIRIDQAVADGKLTEADADLIRGRQGLFSNDAFRSSMQAAFEAAVQQALENDVITQSQADQILSSQSGAGFLNFHGGMRGPGRHGGFDGRMPEGRDSSAPSTPDNNGL
jgi:hypothetical protein